MRFGVRCEAENPRSSSTGKRSSSTQVVPLHLKIPPTRTNSPCGRYVHTPDPREPINLQSALQVVKKLRRRGHEALFAGGWVRDQLLLLRGGGASPTGEPIDAVPVTLLDVDVATSASDEEVLSCFPHTSHFTDSRIRTVVVVDDNTGASTEVTCFRGPDPHSAAQDASRRDFTCNAMFYDPVAQQGGGLVLDYTNGGGQSDLSGGLLRCVGRPRDRFEEDPCRMVRGVRLAAQLGFEVEEKTMAAMRSDECVAWLRGVSRERTFIEVCKGSGTCHQWARTLDLLEVSGLGNVVLPELSDKEQREAAEVAAMVADRPRGREGCWDFEGDEGVTGVRLGSLLDPNTRVLADYKDLGASPGCPKRFKRDILLPRILADLEKRAARLAEAGAGATISPERAAVTNALLDFYASGEQSVACCLWFYSRRVDAKHLAGTSGESGDDFLRRHATQRAKLRRSVELVGRGERVVTSAALEREGVRPGPGMGRLLALAQATSAELGLFEEEEVLEALRASPHWPAANRADRVRQEDEEGKAV